MGDSQKPRRERLRELRRKRADQPGYTGLQTGLQGLWRDLPSDGDTKIDGETLPRAFGLIRNQRLKALLLGMLRSHGGNLETTDSAPGRGVRSDGLGLDNLGKADELSTSSQPEEVSRYRRQLENRADWLEAVLEESLMELDRVVQIEREQQAALSRLPNAKEVESISDEQQGPTRTADREKGPATASLYVDKEVCDRVDGQEGLNKASRPK